MRTAAVAFPSLAHHARMFRKFEGAEVVNKKTLLAMFAGMGLAVSVFFAAVAMRTDFYFLSPLSPFEKLVYVAVIAGVLYALALRGRLVLKMGTLFGGVLFFLGLEYRHSGLSLYGICRRFVLVTVIIGSLFLGWKLLRYFVLYYKHLLDRYRRQGLS